MATSRPPAWRSAGTAASRDAREGESASSRSSTQTKKRRPSARKASACAASAGRPAVSPVSSSRSPPASSALSKIVASSAPGSFRPVGRSTTAKPRARARRREALSKADLPIPAPPKNRSAPPCPSASCPRLRSITASSALRPASPGSGGTASASPRTRTGASGRLFPLAGSGASGSSTTSEASGSSSSATAASTTTSPGEQAFCRRAAVFTGSPITVYSQRDSAPTIPAMTSPRAIAQVARTSTPGYSRATSSATLRMPCCSSRAAATAR